MKKLLALLLLLFPILCGCGNAQTGPVDLYDNFLLTEIAVDHNIIPAMFIPKSGTMMPLCMHDVNSGCAFAGFDQFLASENGKLYYTVNVADKKADGTYRGLAYRVYDYETASTKELCRKTELYAKGTMSSLSSVAGDWNYISQSGNTDGRVIALDPDTGKTVKEYRDLGVDILDFYSVENGQIFGYFAATDPSVLDEKGTGSTMTYRYSGVPSLE